MLLYYKKQQGQYIMNAKAMKKLKKEFSQENKLGKRDQPFCPLT
jgi:hypothetical protein